MKKFNSIKVSIIVIAVACGLLHSAVAQNTNAKAEPEQWRKIHITNGRPDLIGYWIDALHQPAPKEYTDSDQWFAFRQFEGYGQSSSHIDKSGVNYPVFIGKLYVDKENNDLWILSTQSAFDTDKKRIESLDKPLRHVDINIKVLAIDPDDVADFKKQLYSLISPSDPDHAIAVLDQAVADKKVTILKTIDMHTLNYFTSAASWSTIEPAHLFTKNAEGQTEPFDTDTKTQPQLQLKKEYTALFAPCIEDDGTISLDMTFSDNESLIHSRNPKAEGTLKISGEQLPDSVLPLITLSGSPTYNTAQTVKSYFEIYPSKTTVHEIYPRANESLWIKNINNKFPMSGHIRVYNNKTILTDFAGHPNSTQMGLDDKNQNVELLVTTKIANE